MAEFALYRLLTNQSLVYRHLAVHCGNDSFTTANGTVARTRPSLWRIKTANTCKKLLKYKSALWTFIETEGMQPTNNVVEQLISSYVLWRKSSFGTQSDRGALFVERMMTVTSC